MEYRLASKLDINGIAKLHTRSWREAYKGIISDDYLLEPVVKNRLDVWTERLTFPSVDQCVLVAESISEIVGFICLYGAKDESLGTIIDNLHVVSSFKGKGIGKHLLRRAIDWCEHSHPNRGVYLEVLADNLPAIGFYQSLGGRNESEGVWNTPCGTQVKEFIFTWDSPSSLREYL